MANQPNQIVVAEDHEILRTLLERLASQRGYEVASAARGDDAMKLVSHDTQVVLLDISMPGWDGFTCLEWLEKEYPQVPAIVLSAADQVSDAVKAMKLGAVDYITKPFEADELFAVIRKAIELHTLRKENDTFREEITLTQSSSHFEPVAESNLMKGIVERARKAAMLDANVLITGESGTGKGVLARFIHAMSPRAQKPFITVSCPALPRELLESELFGHEKGAFTGALKRRAGKIELAKGGTIFLDEIGDMPVDLQPKLLNVLQDREYQRVGGEETLKADIRIIAATNVQLQQAVKTGAFREDLFYRLSVLTIENPSLRQRPEDVKALIAHVLQNISQRRKCKAYKVAKDAMQALLAYHWPGNVRQLENIMEQSTAFCDDATVQFNDLPAEVTQSQPAQVNSMNLAGKKLEDIEREALKQSLALYQGNRSDTARAMGISEKSVYNMIQRYQLNQDT